MPDDISSVGCRSIGCLIILPLVIARLTLVSQSFQSYNYAHNIESAQPNMWWVRARKMAEMIIDMLFQRRPLAAQSTLH